MFSLLPLLFIEPTSFGGAEFAISTLLLLLLFERLDVLLFALDIEFDECSILGSVGGDTCLSLGNVNFVY